MERRKNRPASTGLSVDNTGSFTERDSSANASGFDIGKIRELMAEVGHIKRLMENYDANST
jgi:hypothetical protein